MILFLSAVLYALTPSTPADVLPVDDLAQPGKHRVQLTVDGHPRVFVLYTPARFKPGDRLPLVLFLHGAGGSAEQAFRTYGWPAKADAENFFVAFPQGLGLQRGGGGIVHVWRDERTEAPIDLSDRQFLETVLDHLQTALPVDLKRVFVAGFSNGAGMTFTLGARLSARLAAIAPVSSQSFTRVEKLDRPLPVYYLVGTADPLVPYRGGHVHMPGLPFDLSQEYAPVQDSAEQWARLDGCPPQPQVVSDDGGVRVLRYGPGAEGCEVIYTVVEGNGHHWPGTTEPLPRLLSGPTLDPFHATDRIWAFFVRHPLP